MAGAGQFDPGRGPPSVGAAVERELRQKQAEYRTLEAALEERISEYETAVTNLDELLREQRSELDRVARTSDQRPRLEERVDRLRQQRWDLVDTFLEEKRELEQDLVRLRGEIAELEAVLE